jgi:hypothetical protein
MTYPFTAHRLRLCLPVCLVAAFTLAPSGVARADYQSITFALDQSNALPDGVTYGTVMVETYDGVGAGGGGLVAGQARITVTIDPSLYSALGPNFGLADFGFNSVAPITAGDISAPAGWTIDPNHAEDGFGKFDWGLVSPSGPGSYPSLVFYVNNLGANATVSNFQKDSSGNAGEGNVFFAAHVMDFTYNLPDGGTVSSDYIGGSDPNGGGGPPGFVTPEPTTLSLTFVGFAGLGLARCLRRKRQLPLQTA